jgi:hypothetical protein
MLSLTDSRWKQMSGGYRVPYDASISLLRLERGEDVWDELWQNLHHQGDVSDASYAAVPHIVRISQVAPRRSWNCYALAATIEIERHRKSNPPLPAWLQPDYEVAWRELAALALVDLATTTEILTLHSALSVVAIARGDLKLGALLWHFDESEIDELAEDKLAWSKLYG